VAKIKFLTTPQNNTSRKRSGGIKIRRKQALRTKSEETKTVAAPAETPAAVPKKTVNGKGGDGKSTSGS